MSTKDEAVEIELETGGNEPNLAQESPVIEKEKVIDPDDGINDLKAKLQEEQRRRFDAENRAREAIQRQYQAQTENEATNYTLVKSAIKTLRGDAEQMKASYKEALAVGDIDRATDIQEKLSETKARLSELKRGRDVMKAQRQQAQMRGQAPLLPQAGADPVETFASQLSARSADWVRRNPQFVTDPRLNQKMIAAHNLVVADNIAPDTDEYFERVESVLNLRRAEPRQESDEGAMSEAAQPVQKRTAPPAAPVSRSASTFSGAKPNVVRLTRQEVETAHELGMTEQEYARNKMLLRKEGRI
jgi:hypothetical protein